MNVPIFYFGPKKQYFDTMAIVQVPLAQLKYLEKQLQASPYILNYEQNGPLLLEIPVFVGFGDS
ncbi:hypothetical protein Ga0466249_003420 [Sporomusaceae bacterium BoRhaA]|nr:hypothetical protein [Pelorhabdus rhamnosifermentans]